MNNSKFKKILFPFIFIAAFCTICATILVGMIIYVNSSEDPITQEKIESMLPPKTNSNNDNTSQP